MALGSHLISSIGFEEEVTHTKRVRERKIGFYCSLSREIFERERAREKPERRNPCKFFPKPGRRERA